MKKVDIVYFRKKESALDGKLVISVVDNIERGRDNIISMVSVKYFNGMNNKKTVHTQNYQEIGQALGY